MIEEKYKDLAELVVNIVEAIKRTGLYVTSLRDRYAKFAMPIKGNGNHIGVMYAGSLFTLGEFTGGIISAVSFDFTKFIPIVKEVNIKYVAMAKSDVSIEIELSESEVKKIQSEAEENGKADFVLNLDLKDENGEVVALVEGKWQIRKLTEEMKLSLGL